MALTTTGSRLITNAMQNAGLLQEGQVPNATQYADNVIRLNDIINFTQTQGLKLWLWQDVPVDLVAGQGSYNIMPGGDVNITKPLNIEDAYYADANGIQRPLANPTAMSWNEWVRLSQPQTTGQINSFFIEKKVDRFVLHLWLVPDVLAATGKVHLIAKTQQSNITSESDSVLFPPEWFIYLHWALAAEICTGQPESVVNRCEAKKQYYLEKLENFDVEDTTVQFQMDPRGTYAQGGFR
jgi:hypothetical protein